MHEKLSGMKGNLILSIYCLLQNLSEAVDKALTILVSAKKDRKVGQYKKIKQHFNYHWNLVKF